VELGRGRRLRKKVNYSDHLTEKQWLKKIDAEIPTERLGSKRKLRSSVFKTQIDLAEIPPHIFRTSIMQ